MFSRVFSMYVGISRRKINDFLLRQPFYQVYKRVRKDFVIKPVISKRPNTHWQMDCISISDEKMVFANNGVIMVLNVVDLYSKKAWSQPLKSKSAEEIKRGLQEVFKTDEPPTVFQSDNGSEFKNEIVDDFLKS